MVGLSAFWRAQVSGPADALDNSITPKPEWQFLFLYQFLKLFKGKWEPVGTTGVPLVLFLILFLLPFYDRNKKRSPLYRPVAMIGCFALIVWFLLFTNLGYYSKPGASLTAKVSVSSQASASVKAGAQLFSSQGCIACHTVHGQGGNIGPNLSDIGSKGLSDQWLTTQLRDPKSHDPSTEMPAFKSLTDQQVKNLVDFLQSLGGSSSTNQSSPSSGSSSPAQSNMAKSSSEPNSVASAAGSPNEPSDSSQHQTTQTSSSISRGQTLFRSQGCIGCHTVDGKGGSVGPDLSNVGSKGLSKQWLMVQLKDPKKHDPSSIMPSFSSLSDQDIQALTTYLESLKGTSGQTTLSQSSQPSTQAKESSAATQSGVSPQQSQPTSEPNAASVESLPTGKAAYLVGNPPHGEKLYNNHCSQCHGKDGKGGVANPGSSAGKIPPLNPISKELFSKNPISFAENIDRYIQHGAVPKGPHPQKSMPAFGDNLKLTQQMMAEIEAYILKLNGVDRAAILHPGLAPYAFFAITVGGYAVAVFVILLLWSRLKNVIAGGEVPHKPQAAEYQTDSTGAESQAGSETSAARSEAKGQAPPSEDQPKDGIQRLRPSSVAFAIIVIIVITIIATAVMLVFSSFVTTKPIPSITTQRITSQEGHSGISTTNSGQSANNQQKENEE
ncbi:MAG: c-type cytochrome [Sedimentisphaerales bacterium]